MSDLRPGYLLCYTWSKDWQEKILAKFLRQARQVLLNGCGVPREGRGYRKYHSSEPTQKTVTISWKILNTILRQKRKTVKLISFCKQFWQIFVVSTLSGFSEIELSIRCFFYHFIRRVVRHDMTKCKSQSLEQG